MQRNILTRSSFPGYLEDGFQEDVNNIRKDETDITVSESFTVEVTAPWNKKFESSYKSNHFPSGYFYDIIVVSPGEPLSELNPGLNPSRDLTSEEGQNQWVPLVPGGRRE